METSVLDRVAETEQDTSMPMPPGAAEDDLGKWVREDMNEQSRCFWIAKGSSTCQHLDGPFHNSITVDGKVKRSCTRSVFTRVHNLTRNQTLRNWLCYSPSKGALFCSTCFLLAKDSSGQFCTGLADWNHAERSISRHETSENHLEAVRAMLVRSHAEGRIDSEFGKQSEISLRYWQDVLKRVVVVIKLLATRGLVFRGSNETIGSPANGNFLAVLEAIAQFDPFLAQHLTKYGNPG